MTLIARCICFIFERTHKNKKLYFLQKSSFVTIKLGFFVSQTILERLRGRNMTDSCCGRRWSHQRIGTKWPPAGKKSTQLALNHFFCSLETSFVILPGLKVIKSDVITGLAALLLYLKMGLPQPHFWLFLFFRTVKFSIQQDSNLVCRSRRRGHWTLDHHHGPWFIVN